MIFNDANQWHRLTDIAAYRAAGRDTIEFRACSASKASGYRNMIVDTWFAQHRELTAELPLRIIYQRPYAEAGSPAEHAAFFIRTLGTLRPGEVPMLDMEPGGAGATIIPNPREWALEWLRIVEQWAGVRAVVYRPNSWANQLSKATLDGRFIITPDYGPNDGQPHNPPPSEWDAWQFSSRGEFPGSPDGPGDINTTPHTAGQILAWGQHQEQPVGEAWKPPEVVHLINNSSARNTQVDLVALHESVGVLDALDLAVYCGSHGVSYHAAADNDKIVYMTPYTRTAWHMRNGNQRSDGLCLTTPTRGYTRDEWLGPQRNKVRIAAWWIADRCAARGLRIAHCTHEQIRAALAGRITDGGVITHNDYTLATGDGSHTDPRNFPLDIAIEWAQQHTTGEDDWMSDAHKKMIELMFDQLTGPGNAQRVINDEAIQWGWPARRYNTDTQPSFTLVDYAREADRELNSRFSLNDRPADDDTDTVVGHVLNTAAELQFPDEPV